VTVHVLNRGADAVFEAADRAQKGGAQVSLATSELASLVDPEHVHPIENDVDEAQWEEMEAGLRHHGRITANFLLLMFLGGAVASIALSKIRFLKRLVSSRRRCSRRAMSRSPRCRSVC
jgi:hypothetical protein